MPSARIAAGCKNRSNMKDIHFRRLPLRNPALLKLWLANLKLKNLPVNAYAKICSAHFKPDCYLRDLRNKLTNAKPKFWLKKDAIPTIFDFSHCSHNSGVTDVPFQHSIAVLQNWNKKEQVEEAEELKKV